MVDCTTITANPIPLPIMELQEVNATLSRENSSLKKVITGRNIFIGILFISSILVGVALYQNQKEERNKI